MTSCPPAARAEDASKFSRWMNCVPNHHSCRWEQEGKGVRCKTCGSGFTWAVIEIGEELFGRG